MKLLLLLFAAADAFFLSSWPFGGGTVGTPSPSQLRRFTPPPFLKAYVAKLNLGFPHEHGRRTPPPDGEDNRRTAEPDIILSRAPSDLSLNRRTPPPPVDLHGLRFSRPPPEEDNRGHTRDPDVILSRAPSDFHGHTPSIRFSRPPPVEDNRGHTAEPIVIRSRAPSDLNRRTPPPIDDLGRTMSPGEDVLLSKAPILNKNRRTPPPPEDEDFGRTPSFRYSNQPAEDRFTHGVLLSRAPKAAAFPSRAPAVTEVRRRTTASEDAEPPLGARRHSLPYALPSRSPVDDLFHHRRSTPGDLPQTEDTTSSN